MTSAATNGSIKPLPHRQQKLSPVAKSSNPLLIMTNWLVNNQIRMPFVALCGLGTIHLLVDQPYTTKFFSLSHFNPSTQLYNKGAWDWAFVTTWVLFFTFLRAILMRFVFQPFFCAFAPNPTTRIATRFAEQAWSAFYYSVSFLVGLYIAFNSPYWGDIREVWAAYPQSESDGFFKAYYLVETAFWLQQVFVLNIEARRKDFWQMLCHHIITCTLIFMSYTYNTTRVGNAILCIMDFSDILLSSAKMLKYLEYQRTCDITFFLFFISWPYTRHYIYNRILYSATFDATRIFHRDNHDKPNYQVIPPKGGGKWKEGYNWDPQQGYYFTYEVHVAFIALLATLQVILLLWFAMIIRLAVRVVRGAPAEDDRSDNEDENDEISEDSAPIPVANGRTSSPGSSAVVTSSITAKDGAAFSNGIHHRKTVG